MLSGLDTPQRKEGAGGPPNHQHTRTTIRAGLPWVTFHTFRHTCASLLVEAGRDVKQVQEWLGHADPGFTLRTYIHLMDGGVGSADFLDEAVGASVLTQRPPEVPRSELARAV